MSKYNLTDFLKAFYEKVLVILQFCIISLHFVQFHFFTKKEILQVDFIFNLLGYLIIIIASFILLLAIKDLGSNLSPFPKPKDNGTLITRGIYSYVRHPMYYSLIGISFGIFLTRLTFYYLFLTICIIFIIKLKIYLEDQYLGKKYRNYSLYKNKVQY